MIDSPNFSAGYRGRLAPSPTGLLHLGHARTFWTAYERARAAGGILVLRNEDLDRERAQDRFWEAIVEDLTWLGIRWREGPDVGGPYGPYAQSQRSGRYLDAWRQLLLQGCIYPCRCSRKDLAQAAQAPHDDEAVYPGTCRPRIGRRESGAPGGLAAPRPRSEGVFEPGAPDGRNWRFRVPDGEVVAFEDRSFGPQHFVAGRDFGDFLVWRRDGLPSYQLAAVVDDAAMRITEVVRGADLLKSTARQILLARALQYESPGWRHCPLVCGSRGERLAKRHDALSLRTLRAQGVSPAEAVDASLDIRRFLRRTEARQD